MRTTCWMVCFTVVAMLTGCDTVTEPDLLLDSFRSSASQTASSEPDVVEASIVFAQNGTDQSLTFHDTHGNSYLYEGQYDSSGSLVRLVVSFNGSLLGIVHPHWQGGSASAWAVDSHSAWARGDASFHLTSTGFGGLDCGAGDCFQITSSYSCWNELNEYGWQSLGLVGSVMLAGGAAVSSGGLTLGGSIIGVAYMTRNWNRAMRSLDACKRGSGDQSPPQVDPDVPAPIIPNP